MDEKEKARWVCLDILSRETIPSIACRLNVPNFVTHPEYDDTVMKSPTFQFADATWFFEFESNSIPHRQNKVRRDDEDASSFSVYLVRLNSVIQQEIFMNMTLKDENGKDTIYGAMIDSNLFVENNNKYYMVNFENRGDFHDSFLRCETLCLIIKLFCEKLAVSDEKKIQNNTNEDLETETTKIEENCNVNLELSTRKSFSSIVCTLKIPNFFIMPEYDGTVFESQALTFANASLCFRFSSESRWKSKDEIRDEDIHFKAYMIRLDSEIPEQQIFYKIALLDNNDKEHQEEVYWTVFREGDTREYMQTFDNTCLNIRDSLTLIIRLFYDKPTEKESYQLQNTTQRGITTVYEEEDLKIDEEQDKTEDPEVKGITTASEEEDLKTGEEQDKTDESEVKDDNDLVSKEIIQMPG